MALGIILLILGYFIPTAIAMMRSHKDTPAIAAINILFGWTIGGWFVAFFWALSDPRGRAATQTVVVNTAVSAATGSGPVPETRAAAASDVSADLEVAYWDKVDRNDAFHIEEFLVRFPDGRFARLARARLESLNGGSPGSASVTKERPASAAPAPADCCKSCGTTIEADDKFCADCGAAVPA